MKRHNKTSLFLMELILSILLFSLCSAVCVQLFVSAYRTEQDAQALTWATMLCDSMAAQIKDSKDPDGLRPVCYDSDFLPCENSDDAAWLLTVSPVDEKEARIAVTACPAKDSVSTPLYEIVVAY